MGYRTNEFKNNSFEIGKKNLQYYISTLLKEFKFTHAFFPKVSSEYPIEKLAYKFNSNKINYFNKQIHSNNIVLGSKYDQSRRIEADGIISDKSNQNIWIYTADCMPILFADKGSRIVAAAHCGRKGLEKKIIIKILDAMKNLGSQKKNILVAIGPSISKENYLVDEKCLKDFYKKIFNEIDSNQLIDMKNRHKNSKHKYNLDIREYAYKQLINNGIIPHHIDISNKCTYKANSEFFSWRKEKNSKRNWNFISSK